MHVTFLSGLIVPASYDECTALVKSDGASKHVWKAVKGAYKKGKKGEKREKKRKKKEKKKEKVKKKRKKK